MTGSHPRRDAMALSLHPLRHRREAGRLREVFVLSGGGSLGAAQVGSLRALLEAGVVPDAVVGCSVGALNAAYLAIDPTLARVDALQRLWSGIGREDVFGRTRFTESPFVHAVKRD